jgi:TrmH family RNA methyltransferase
MPTGLFQAGIRGPGWHILPEKSLCYGLPPTQLGATSNAWNRVAIWPIGAPWLASCCRLETPFRKKKLCSKRQFDGLRVVLVNTRNPLNIGAAARAMSNFGFLHLRVVNPFELAFREARSAVGAAPLLAQAEEFKSLAEAVADCSLVVGTSAVGRRDPQHLVWDLPQGGRMIRKRLGRDRVALLFGSEKRGLSNDDLSHCHWLLRVPTREEHRSMNLGQAVAVSLYELAREGTSIPARQKTALATTGDLERLTSLLLGALLASGYLKAKVDSKSRAPAPVEEKIRRLIRRMNLSAEDVELLLGMVRQILWKIKT